MNTLTKSDMIDLLSREMGMNRVEAKLLVDHFFEAIVESILLGQSVKLSGLGNFEVKQKSSRPGRNPKTGEVVPVTARKVVTFKAGQKMRQLIEERANPNIDHS